jgi:hypothetical protein
MSAFWPILTAKAESQRLWSRGFSSEPANSIDRAREFVLFSLDQDELHLIGTWSYTNGTFGNKTPPRVVIEGTKTADGIFWPEVRFEVRKTRKTKWRRIATSPNEGQRASVTIEPNAINFDLTVNLDAFKVFLGKYESGRIILNSGRTSEFELKDLLPSEQGAQPPKNDSVDRTQPKATAPTTGLGSINAADDTDYRRVLESKLFVTRADCARISVRPPASPEFALSVYSLPGRRLPTRRSYHITVTKASKSIYHSLQENEAVDISVGRLDARIPADTAVALKGLWKKILSQTPGSELSMLPSSDGEIVEFSLDTWKNSLSAGELEIIAEEQTVRVQRLRDLLMKYCTAARFSISAPPPAKS